MPYYASAVDLFDSITIEWICCMPKLCSSCFTLVGQDNYMQKYSWPLASWTWCYNTTGQWPCRLIHNFIFRCFQGGRGVSSNSISTFFRFMEGFGPFLTLTSNIGFWGPKQKTKIRIKRISSRRKFIHG